jgi:hypothetical protein
VRAFGVVELQGGRDGFEHGLGDTAERAALHPVVVVDAYPGQGCYFFAPQPLHPAGAAVPGHPRLLRGEAGTP